MSCKMVLRVSVPFPVILFGKEERPNTELAEKSLLPAGVSLPIIQPGMRNKTLDCIFSSLVSKRRMATFF
jgi:hypothetical protein